MGKRFYLTTSIPYVNGAPHVGHALEFVQADVFARYHRLLDEDTWLLTGTDDNSLNNVLAAEREAIPVQALVDRNAAQFDSLTGALHISNDDFIRTSTQARHREGAVKFWRACLARGDIYKRFYSGLYCVGCERYYTPGELSDGVCPEHGVPPELVEEENYFFRLSRYRDALVELVESGRLRIVPETRRNEVRRLLDGGLEDFSISRSRTRARGWGIAVPDDPEQVIYVWFDALTNYITALGYASDGPAYRRYWLENPHRLHVIGKGILRFHAVFWPAMLLSAGVPLPETIFVHGYVTLDGGKISKSRGNVVDPSDLVGRYGPDAVRYWLLRAVPATGDADYTDAKLQERYDAELADDLGNLVNRTVSLLQRYRAGRVPRSAGDERVDGDDALPALATRVVTRLHAALGEALDPQAALDAVWLLVRRANRYVEETQPWALAKAEAAGDTAAGRRLDAALCTLAESVRLLAELLRPLLPETAQRIAAQLGVMLVERRWSEALAWGIVAAGTVVQQPQPLFPKRARAAVSPGR